MKEAKRLSIREFSETICGGGWFVTGGYKVRRESSPVEFPVTKIVTDSRASFDEEGLWTGHTLLITARGHGTLATYELSREEIFLTDPQTVQICRVVLDERLLRK